MKFAVLMLAAVSGCGWSANRDCEEAESCTRAGGGTPGITIDQCTAEMDVWFQTLPPAQQQRLVEAAQRCDKLHSCAFVDCEGNGR